MKQWKFIIIFLFIQYMNVAKCADGDSTEQQQSNESSKSKIPKFSIGKDVNETFPDIEDIVSKLNNSNITDDQFINELFNALNITFNMDNALKSNDTDVPITTTTTVVTPKATTTTVPTTMTTTTTTVATTTTTTTSVPTTTTTVGTSANTTTPTPAVEVTQSTTRIIPTTTEGLFKRLERIKLKLSSLHKLKDKKGIKQLVNDTIASSDVTNLNKGRTTEDTKEILNYMITALYSMKQKNESFDTNRFFDEVIIKPQDVMPDGLFESDIVLSKDQAYEIFGKYLNENSTQRYKRKVVRELSALWPMPISYMFDGSHTTNEKDVIRASVRRWEEETCIQFREITSASSASRYLRFIKGGGCYSSVGYYNTPGAQDVSLSDGCVIKGTALHEIGHALGFFHEQSRPDRDRYVDINLNNIQAYKETNFERYTEAFIDTYGLPYDLASDMHYGGLYFSKNNQLTVQTKQQQYQRTIGQRVDLTFMDIKTANKVYCKNKCSSTINCERNGYQNPKTCNSCLCPEGFGGTTCNQVAASSAGCGGTLTAPSGTIKSLNYPNKYTSYSKCFWLIKAPIGQRIRLTFIQTFKVTCDYFATYGPCDQDWLEIRYKKAEFDVGGPRFCCNIINPAIFESDSNEMMVLFYSTRNNIDSTGFIANYEFINDGGIPISTTAAPTTTTTTTTTTKFDHCTAQPCLNKGLCSNVGTGFFCTCQPGFVGSRCEIKQSKCDLVTCLNNGVCIDASGECLCQPGYTDPKCGTKITVAGGCANNPCVKGVCVDLGTTFKCLCFANYTGSRCELSIKNCREGLCMNAGTCVESALFEGFLCQCQSNYYGIFCEKSICSTDICEPDGVCSLKSQGGYTCTCKDGTVRENCRQHPCDVDICGQYGACQRKNSSYTCDCIPGFTGRNCESKINSCEPNPCVHGTCEAELNTYKCTCNAGFSGRNCDLLVTGNSCTPNPCQNGGICIEKDGKFSCFCPQGFVGLKCENRYTVESNACSLNPCKRGTCIPQGNDYRCLCEQNYVGLHCDAIDPCLSSPCLNGATCLLTLSNTYMCSCSSGFTGKNCDALFNNCASQPCPPSHYCANSPSGYACYPTAITNNAVLPCASNPCQNDGSCSNVDTTSYSCKCKFGYIGARCEWIDQCLLQPNACKNNGQCVMNGNILTCLCPSGYQPPYCEKSTTVGNVYCQVNVCRNGGTCVHTNDNTIASMKCQCLNGFSGVFCEIASAQRDEDQSDIGLSIPSFCKEQNKNQISSPDTTRSFTVTRTPFSYNGFYIIQDGYIWFIIDNIYDHKNWPKKFNDLFPTIPDSPDAIFYDDLSLSYTVFKLGTFWKFKANFLNPHEKLHMMPGYPKSTKEVFGLDKVDGGAYIKADYSYFSKMNNLYLLKESKLIQFKDNRAVNVLPLPVKANDIHSIVPDKENSFYAITSEKIYNFMIFANGTALLLRSINNEMKNSFLCAPFYINNRIQFDPYGPKNTEKLRNTFCYDLSLINSIIKFNSSTALLLSGNELYYLDITNNGYKLHNIVLNPDININKQIDGYINAMIYFNQYILFFQPENVWIYSTKTKGLLNGESGEVFKNLFPNNGELNSIISAHYSQTNRKFYFFSDFFYLEYENETTFKLKLSTQGLSSKLTNVIQNYADDTSVYLVDANGFVYYLNLNDDYLESVNRQSASYELFADCNRKFK